MSGRPDSRTLPRLYAILDIDACASRHLAPEQVADVWLSAGVRLIQLRAKPLSFGPMLALAERLARACASAGATFIVNDRADVARLCGADGVHVGQDDLSPREVRRVAPDLAWVGLSTHTEAQWAAALEAPVDDVDYVAAGPVYTTTTKARQDDQIGLEGVRRAARAAAVRGVPLVAIGGITRETAADVLAAGAASVAVIADLLAPPPMLRARVHALLERVAGV